MSNPDPVLQIQAYLDGELPDAEAREVERLLASDPGASALAAELAFVGESLRDTDPVRRVPDSREFYWAQIRRRLEPAGSPVPASGRWPRMLGWLIPAFGVAVAALLLSLPGTDRQPAEVEVAATRMLASGPAVTFHSDTDGVTIHWVQ